jgi:hypothetical protein
MSITRVQGQATASASTTTSQAATVGSGVTLGNLLVAAVSTGAIGNSVTPPTGWTQAVFNQPNSPANDETGLWYIVVAAGQAGSTSFTFTFGSAHNVYIIIEEWSATNGWNASPVDQTAVGNTAGTATTSTTPLTGTTSTTTQASELWVATLMYSAGVQTESSITSGWTKDLETHDSGNNHTATMLYQIASSTGAAACQYTIGTAEHWAGAVATFKPVVIVTTTRTVPATAVLMSTVTRTIPSTVVLLSTTARTIPASVVLMRTTTRTIPATADIAVTTSRTIPCTIALDQPVTRTIPATVVLMQTVTRTIPATIVLMQTVQRTIPATADLSTTTTRTIPATIALATTTTRTIPATVVLMSTTTRTIPATVDLVRTVTRTIPATVDLSNTITRTIPATVDLSVELLSGGFAVFANGTTGTVSIDHFRVVEYPDPSLSLAPLIPRLGFSSVSWNSQLATNTTLGVDLSLDGVNWTDVTADNGLPIPLLTAQPAFVVDGFSTNTSANYTSTFRTGGSLATWTIDTTNSRLIAVGGTNALYISNQVNRADVDLFVDLNRSDTGGIVWRYTDANNFYFAQFTDSISTSTQQTLTINRVASNVLTTLATASISFQRTLVTRCRVSMLASLITASVDGVVVATYTDGSPLSGTAIGVYSNGGTNYCTQLWIQPQGDYVTGTPPLDTVTGDYVYTRQRLATTDPSVTPYVLDFTISTANPDINQGTLIPSITYDHTLVSANFDDLAKQSNFSWYINNREVIFRLPGAVPSPWVIQSALNGLPSWIEPDSNLIVTQANNALYRNRQILTNVIGTGVFSNTFVGDGSSTSFTLSYPIAVGTIPTITLDGVVQTVALKGTTGSQWYYAEGDLVIAQDASGTVITAIDTLVVSPYTGTFTMTVTVDNTTAQATLALAEGASGIVEEVEDVSKLNMYYPAALTYAQQLLARYCLTGRTIVFKTYRNGLDLLQIATVFFPEFNLNDAQLLITEIDVAMQTQPNNTVLYNYIVTATELPNIVSWSKLLGTLFLSGS